jgi:hypothetical protein
MENFTQLSVECRKLNGSAKISEANLCRIRLSKFLNFFAQQKGKKRNEENEWNAENEENVNSLTSIHPLISYCVLGLNFCINTKVKVCQKISTSPHRQIKKSLSL